MAATPREVARGIWRWTARHPEWHPGEFGREVASFALAHDDATLLIDPLLPDDEPEPVLELLERLGGGRTEILITIPYHVRSAEELWRRARRRTRIWGHPLAAKRLDDRAGFHAVEPGTKLPLGIQAQRIGNPRRSEMPLLIPSHGALAFGDAVAEVDGRLRVWQEVEGAGQQRWYRERLLPSFQPLLELDFERVLVTHGKPVLKGGHAALERALADPPWHRGLS
jgi:glyoxylase-like metal-dependent hydrolase (beta-lactamase superfamily II)